MKSQRKISNPRTDGRLETELLILPDGRILVHNLTQPFAELLRHFNPAEEQIASRAGSPCKNPKQKHPTDEFSD